jgi:peptidoglycan/LPS O-acetylase OafA/YrhL
VTGVAFAHIFDTPQQIQWAVHNMTTSHIDAFASGGLLALIPANWRTRLLSKSRRILFSMVAVTVICGLTNSLFLASRNLPPHWQALGYDNMCYLHQYVWGYTLLNLASASLILCLIDNRFLPSIFQHPAAIYLGTVSYGIYVWHLPLLHILFNLWPADFHSLQGFVRFLTLLALSVLTAFVSYFYFERLFLRMKQFKFDDIKNPF